MDQRKKWEIFLLNDNENITHQNTWDSVKALLGQGWQFKASNAHVKQEERLKVNYVRIYFKKLGVKKKNSAN